LSSLLLVLLPVFAGLPGAEGLFPPAALVVLLSVVIHGGAQMVIGKGEGGRGKGGAAAISAPRPEAAPPPDPAPAIAPVLDAGRITLDDMRRLQAAGARVRLLDVRTERSYNETETRARGAIRLAPEGNVAERAAELALPRHDWLVAYCA
jgi:hypothetical protein